jgi:mannitol-1-phosphate 5-dehydrogenase
MNKLVLFGAGKIGRSFIAQLFSRSGYEVVFVDINKELIEELNCIGKYKVIIKSEEEEILSVTNVRGIHSSDENKISHEIADARILAVSVGLRGLPFIMPVLAKSLLSRYENGNHEPIDIIIAENMRNAADYFHKELSNFLPVSYPLKEIVGFVETSIGKMVPIMLKKDVEKDMLQVFAEPYNTLILDKKAFKNSIPDVKGLDPKENMKAWTDRKLFIHNLGHAAVAYYGYMCDNTFIYLWQALQVQEVHGFVRDTMLQAADILLAAYPDEFTIDSLTQHIDDLLDRFSNKFLGDTIFRIGCDLYRKLSPDDRIVGAIRMAELVDRPYDKILQILVCACHFRAADENGIVPDDDIEFIGLYEKGIENVLVEVCGFDSDDDKELIASITDIENSIYGLKPK